jgi:hypothetical protein
VIDPLVTLPPNVSTPVDPVTQVVEITSTPCERVPEALLVPQTVIDELPALLIALDVEISTPTLVPAAPDGTFPPTWISPVPVASVETAPPLKKKTPCDVPLLVAEDCPTIVIVPEPVVLIVPIVIWTPWQLPLVPWLVAAILILLPADEIAAPDTKPTAPLPVPDWIAFVAVMAPCEEMAASTFSP